MDGRIKIQCIEEIDVNNKIVLLRIDINSPLDPINKKIVSENRINKSIPTIEYLINNGAKIAIIAHQGDTLDYDNLISMEEHAKILSRKLGKEVKYIDDVCGPFARENILKLEKGDMVLLGNLRYLSEEISTFEDAVKLEPKDMLNTYLVRSLAPIIDIYINDAFSAAHRNSPSMVAFQEIKKSVAGILFFKEITALDKVLDNPTKPSVFLLGGLKISDAFGMMRQVLEKGTADKILCCGITGQIMLMAMGYDLGKRNEKFIKDRNLDVFIEPARNYLSRYKEKILYPLDLAFEREGTRFEVQVDNLAPDELYLDIGCKTIEAFKRELKKAGTIFVNGPAGVYEKENFKLGTKSLWEEIADSKGYSVIGGGDTVSAAQRFIDTKKIDYICTAGGAMVRFLSGDEMPLIKAMEKAYERDEANV